MWAALAKIGVPERIIRAIQTLYKDMYTFILCGGALHLGFDMTGGVAQGCPLAAALYVISTDCFGRLLIGRLKDDLAIGTYIDDTNLVLKHFAENIATLQASFVVLEKATGLKLNGGKCTAIPLDPVARSCIRATLSLAGGIWSLCRVKKTAKLLGIFVGPGASLRSWTKPMQKMRQRTLAIKDLQLGLARTSVLFNAVAFSCVAYIASLCVAPHSVCKIANRLFHKLTSMPFNAMPAEVIHGLSRISMGASIFHLGTFQQAAKLRVFASLPELEEQWNSVTILVPGNVEDHFRHPLHHWLSKSICSGLVNNYRDLCSLPDVCECFGKPKLQRTVYLELRKTKPPLDPSVGLQRRMLHFDPDAAEDAGDFIARWMPVVASSLGPGVVGASLKVMCNGLNTSSRYRNTSTGGLELDCKFCYHLGGDNLRHLLSCPQVSLALADAAGYHDLPLDENIAVRFFCWLDTPSAEQMKIRAVIVDFIVKAYQQVPENACFLTMRGALRRSIAARIAHWTRFGRHGYSLVLDSARRSRGAAARR